MHALPTRDGPGATPALLERPRLERLLDGAFAKRLTCVVAGAGYGKSTLVERWGSRFGCAWHTLTPADRDLERLLRAMLDALEASVPALPEELHGARALGPDAADDERGAALASAVCAALAEQLADDLVLVLDDVHELEGAAGPVRLIETACRQAPPRLHLVLCSRREAPFPIERLRGQGQVLELVAADLAFTAAEIAALVEAVLGEGATDLAAQLHDATAGWPVAVRLALEAAARAPAGERLRALERARLPGGALFAYLAEEVFEREPATVRELVRAVAPLDRFTPALCEALGVDGAGEALASLAKRGLFLEPSGEVGWFALIGLVRDYARARLPLERPVEHHRRAADWFAAAGRVEEAARALEVAGDADGVARLLAGHGRALLRSGGAEHVVRLSELVPPDARDDGLEELVADAQLQSGRWSDAVASLHRAAARRGALAPGLAWRLGMVHHLRAELDEALAVYAQVGGEDGADPRDLSLLHAWRASSEWMRGDSDAGRDDAGRALSLALTCDDSQALAAAHVVAGAIAFLAGDRRVAEEHHAEAFEHARRAGDVLQSVRAHANYANGLILDGRFAEAIRYADEAVRLSDLSGYAGGRGFALSIRGMANLQLARVEEAVADMQASRAVNLRLGSRNLAMTLADLGDAYRIRGDRALARASYEEALVVGTGIQVGAQARIGLVRLLADDEPDAAEEHAARALEATGGSIYRAEALVAAGVAARGRGNRRAALAYAEEAEADARAHGHRPALADALELRGGVEAEPELARRRLGEAAAIWRELGNPLGEARVELARARLLGGTEGRTLAADVQSRAGELGAHGLQAEAADLVRELDRSARPLEIRTLGGFRVLRGGEPVPASEWQSKKARDLLKLLVARRGRPAPRELLAETLWPEDDPARLGHRLAVALNVLRGVLDPDRRSDPQRFVVGERGALALDLGELPVDAERFLADASAGLELWRGGRRKDALPLLRAADARYAGDFLEEDLYEDWAAPLREEARAAYVEVARALASDAAAGGDPDSAARHLLRILERDPYDERAQLDLVLARVAAGAHGEARRAYGAYCARMEEIGVEPAAFPVAPDGPSSARA